MGKLRDSSILFYADEKYNSIFDVFTKGETKLTIDLKELFVLAATIGFKNTKRIKQGAKGKEIRAAYLTHSEEELFLSMLLNDREIKNDIEVLESMLSSLDGKKIIEEYINGGLELIATKAFSDNWDGYNINSNYQHYHYDLARFILSEVKKVPF
ncbi:hypothetical protein [Staphylococcus debuckii]|uniref:Phage protein n=1 Tax=Staphylococcus debuckii TaxID=2044912 RepID=A0ABU9EV90_9STAP